ncbi:MAG: M24 family metallopeptidase [Polaromonas sp.]|uniref:M24 family metallopeptidase n=1 Tax=Polaromonas sp. TaxID=1869339 RepID=UPI002487841B|nr:M24 family metallopeptidase [Polaromonas sp.]MDI1269230.1 M24 family metallopeptidase [Polaromonas sp.]
MTFSGLPPTALVPVEAGPVLSLKERDRRWNGLRAEMRKQDVQALVVGSFQGRERLESYLIDDFLDSVAILTHDAPVTVVTFSPSRLSRVYESERRGIEPWVTDYRIAGGGAGVGAVLRERGLDRARIGIVGYGPTAPGEMEGQLPHGFHRSPSGSVQQAELVDFTCAYTDFILVKSDEELALLRFAARVSEQASHVMAEVARPGVSEALMYAEVLREIHRLGCDRRYPFMSLQSGADNIAWGAPRWTLRAEPPRILQRGDVVQTEIHTLYGGQEAQVQMCVALDPVDPVLLRCEQAARASYEAGIAAVRPGATFADVVHAMERPLAESGCWSKTPLLHTLTFGATGFTPVNREQLAGTREGAIEGPVKAGIRRGDLVLREGMSLELEPNACLGTRRINIGAGVIVTRDGCEELNRFPTRMFHATEDVVLS